MKTNQRTPMKGRTRSRLSQTALLLATGFLLTHCSPDQEKVAPAAPVQELVNEALQHTPEPTAVPSPETAETTEERSNFLFPKDNSASARTAAYSETTGFVDFNDPAALNLIPDKAANLSRASWPFYIQQVGNAWIHVKENNGIGYHEAFRSDYGYYLLPYQNFNPCIIQNGTTSFGKPSGNSCLPFNPVQEPRRLNTHFGDQWIKIYAYDEDHPTRVFDLLGLTNMGGSMQVWFKQKDGGWKAWKNLPIGQWTTTQANSVTEVLIGPTGNGPFSIDNIKLRVPAN